MLGRCRGGQAWELTREDTALGDTWEMHIEIHACWEKKGGECRGALKRRPPSHLLERKGRRGVSLRVDPSARFPTHHVPAERGGAGGVKRGVHRWSSAEGRVMMIGRREV